MRFPIIGRNWCACALNKCGCLLKKLVLIFFFIILSNSVIHLDKKQTMLIHRQKIKTELFLLILAGLLRLRLSGILI
jgi:hypothetical protein